MRVKTRCDTWRVVVLSVAALSMIVVPSTLCFTDAAHGAQMWMFLVGPLIMAFVLSLTFPQYYELRDDGMFIRQG